MIQHSGHISADGFQRPIGSENFVCEGNLHQSRELGEGEIRSLKLCPVALNKSATLLRWPAGDDPGLAERSLQAGLDEKRNLDEINSGFLNPIKD